MKLLKVTNSTRNIKKLMAIFKDGDKYKTVHFGMRGSETYIDGASRQIRNNYIARHRAREERLWRNDPLSPATLSRYITWGNSRDINVNIARYKNKFGL